MIHTCTSRSFRNLSGRFRGVAPHLVMLGLVCFEGRVPDEHPVYLTNLTSTMQTVSRLLLPDNDVKNNKLDKPHRKQEQGFLRDGFQKWSFWVRGQWGAGRPHRPGGPGPHTVLWVSRRSSSHPPLRATLRPSDACWSGGWTKAWQCDLREEWCAAVRILGHARTPRGGSLRRQWEGFGAEPLRADSRGDPTRRLPSSLRLYAVCSFVLLLLKPCVLCFNSSLSKYSHQVISPKCFVLLNAYIFIWWTEI